jgi:zinc/manganese transport system substrate-binding protein
MARMDGDGATRMGGPGTDASKRRVLGLYAATLLTACIAMVGCSHIADPRGAATPGAPVRVVAAENLYGDIAGQIGGSAVTVTSILSDPDADPHLFEPGTANGVAVADAQVVIMNGLGYDDFMQRLLEAAPDPERKVVTIADILDVTGADANPHLWYDLPRVPAIAEAIADALSASDPADRSAFQERLAAFDASLKPLDAALHRLQERDAGTPVAYTEPVPGYLLQAAGLPVETPEAFALAIEEGNEPTPQAVAAMNALFTDRKVRLLLYNSQATSPITERLRQLAERSGVPVVPVTETLPPGEDFQSWQLAQLRGIEAALAR